MERVFLRKKCNLYKKEIRRNRMRTLKNCVVIQESFIWKGCVIHTLKLVKVQRANKT